MIVCSVVPPTFPNNTCKVTDAGAVGDGKTDNTAAFAKAIATCEQMGGGHVDVPAGNFVSGAIHLDDNIDLHLEAGATISFSGDASKYLPKVLTRHEGIELMNYSPPIYAYGKMNVGITGAGTLDFSATASWNKNGGNGENQLVTWDNSVPLPDPMTRNLAAGDSLAVANVEPYSCTNVLIQGITLKHAHWWQLHPTLSTNVTVDGVTADGTGAGHTDGFDPESCTNVVLENSTFITGDDGMAIKAGRNNDGRRIHTPTSNVVVMHTTFSLAPGAFGGPITCGSEAYGVNNVYAYDLKLGNNHFLLYMKSNMQRGGNYHNINIDTVTGSNLATSVAFITMNYTASGGGGASNFPPSFDDINISNVKIDGAPVVLQVVGLANDPIGQITLTNDTFTNIGNSTSSVQYAKPVIYNQTTINGQPAH